MKPAEWTLVVVGGVALGVGIALWNGYVLSILWGWFVVPLGVPAIGVAHAIGIALIVGALNGGVRPPQGKGSWLPLASWFIGTFFALGIGYIVKGCMA